VGSAALNHALLPYAAHSDGQRINLLPTIRQLWNDNPAVADYVRIEEFTVRSDNV
jgi:hypothetical protein